MDLGSSAVGIFPRSESSHGNAPGIGLLPFLSVFPDGEFQPFRKGVYHRESHSVEPSGNLVGFVIELAPRMKHREYHFCGGFPRGWVLIHGNAPAVVLYGNAVIRMDGYFHVVAYARQGFIQGVVHNFVNQVV